MSPNGRRAWREWVRRQDLRRKHKQPKGSVCRMARQARRHIPLVPGVMLPKFITARSLVGMSASAKKRAARALFVKHVFTSQGTEIKPDDQGPRWHHLWCRGSGDVASRDPDYAALRSKYRIGERLRPCPGCPECDHNKRWRCGNCGATKRQCNLILADVRCKCGKGCGQWRISFPATTVCDGSGALPARHQLCLGCSWCGTPPKEGATRFTECDGSGVLPARKS